MIIYQSVENNNFFRQEQLTRAFKNIFKWQRDPKKTKLFRKFRIKKIFQAWQAQTSSLGSSYFLVVIIIVHIFDWSSSSSSSSSSSDNAFCHFMIMKILENTKNVSIYVFLCFRLSRLILSKSWKIPEYQMTCNRYVSDYCEWYLIGQKFVGQNCRNFG